MQNMDQSKDLQGLPSRRDFLAVGAGALAVGALPVSAFAERQRVSLLGRYAWGDAVAFWQSSDLGSLRGVYVTLGAAEYAAVGAVEATAQVLAELSPLVDIKHIVRVSAVGSGGAVPAFWTCTFTTGEGTEAVITLRKGIGQGPVLRGVRNDLEVFENGMELYAHSGAWLGMGAKAGGVEFASASSYGESLGVARQAVDRALLSMQR